MDSVMKSFLLAILLVPLFCAGQSQAPGFFFFNKPTNVATIIVAGTLPLLTTTVGSHSGALFVQVSGSSLTTDVAVGAISGLEYSTDSINFFSTLNLTHSGAVLAGQPVPLWVRITSSAPVGSTSGFILLTAFGASTVSVAYSAQVNPLTGNESVQVQFWDGVTAGSRMHQPTKWNVWTPANLDFGGTMTTTSPALTDTNGTSTAITVTMSVGALDNTTNSFFTQNGSGYAAATTSGFSDTVFQTPYLFTGGTVGQDTLIFNNLPSSSSNFTVEVISSRATSTSRPETFTIGSTTIPSSGSFDAMNNLNNKVGGFVPLRWANVAKDANNKVKLIINYTNQFGFYCAARISWNP